MMLMGIDQSVRGFAFASAPDYWNGNWNLVDFDRFDGGKLSREANDMEHGVRLGKIFRWVDARLCEHSPNLIGFESYAYGSGADYDVVELTGAIKLHLLRWQKEYVTINQSSARKLMLGKVPRKSDDCKKAVRDYLLSKGAPPRLTLDETDAFCVLNFMMFQRGSFCYAKDQDAQAPADP